VLRVLAAVAISMLGCGRLKFDASSDAAADAPPDQSAEIPPVPPSICNVDRIDIGPTTRVTDLAVTATAAGYAAVWLDGGAASAITLGPLGPPGTTLHPELGRGTIDTLRATELTGMSAVNQSLLIASSDGNAQTVLVLDSSLAAMPAQTLVFPGYIAGNDPFPIDEEQGAQAFLAAAGDTFELRRVNGSDGKIVEAIRGTSSTGATISQFSCDDGPDHGHCTWIQAQAGQTPECFASDAFLDTQMPIQFDSAFADCPAVGGEIRVSTAPADTVMAVFKTPSQDLEAHWLRGNDVLTPLGRGSSPRIRWDRNDVFWIAWLDSQSVLQLSSLDVSGMPVRLVTHPLPDWKPSSPAAFELVRRRNATGDVSEIGLVLIAEGSRTLDFLSVCL
jgi:hypothetical protein